MNHNSASPRLSGENAELRPLPPRARLAALLRDRQDAWKIKGQRTFAAHLGLGLQKVNRWLNESGPEPTAKDWAVLEEKLQLNGTLSAVREAFKEKRKVVFKAGTRRHRGFEHGDGI